MSHTNPMLSTPQAKDLPREAARARHGYGYKDDFFRRLVVYSADRLEGEMMRFFAEHCHKFQVEDAMDEEHRLEWTEVHKVYEKVLEKHLQGFCDEEGITMDDFMAKMLESKDDEEAGGIVSAVVASGDYLRFVELMRRRAAMRARK